MAFSSATLQMLGRLTTRLRDSANRAVDVHYMSMSARYADHVIGLALRSPDTELKAIGALLRHDFFGPAGLFAGGKMLWSMPDYRSEPDVAGPQTLDFAPPPTTDRRQPALSAG